jgi:regulator of protease activity HflC (stomatin/prohibitin superfamily)
METEQTIEPVDGYIMLAVAFLSGIGALALFANHHEVMGALVMLIFIFVAAGFITIAPNNAKVLLLFGKYVGSVKDSGLFWVIPFYKKIPISVRARNFESDNIKVNDKSGNPIMISVILVWKVRDTFMASFAVNDYENFVRIQTDAAVRKLAGSYSYDHFEDERASVTLTTNFEEVNKTLEHEIMERLQIAGIEVIEARIGYLAYAPEIAHSMLRRQQASAVVAARHKIVEGAVGMVESALNLLSNKNIIELDEEKKAAMVSNLMVVLCGDKDTSPVVNTGTLNQ